MNSKSTACTILKKPNGINIAFNTFFSTVRLSSFSKLPTRLVDLCLSSIDSSLQNNYKILFLFNATLLLWKAIEDNTVLPPYWYSFCNDLIAQATLCVKLWHLSIGHTNRITSIQNCKLVKIKKGYMDIGVFYMPL